MSSSMLRDYEEGKMNRSDNKTCQDILFHLLSKWKRKTQSIHHVLEDIYKFVMFYNASACILKVKICWQCSLLQPSYILLSIIWRLWGILFCLLWTYISCEQQKIFSNSKHEEKSTLVINCQKTSPQLKKKTLIFFNLSTTQARILHLMWYYIQIQAPNWSIVQQIYKYLAKNFSVTILQQKILSSGSNSRTRKNKSQRWLEERCFEAPFPQFK